MVSSGDILDQFKLKKSKLDYLTRRYRNNWGLVKDGKGNYMWSAESVAYLKIYLDRPTKRPPKEEVAEVSSTNSSYQTEQIKDVALMMATAMNEKVTGLENRLKESQESALKKYQQEILTLKEEHKKDIQSLKEILAAQATTLDSKLAVLVEKNTKAIKEKDQIINTLVERVERRRQPTEVGFLEKVYRKLVIEPFLLTERRKN